MVLVLTSLLATLIIQSLVYVLSLRERVLTQLEISEAARLSEHWYRQSLNAVVADLDERERRFAGSSDAFSAITLTAIHQPYGVPTQIRWTIDSDGATQHLRYEAEDHDGFDVLTWRGGSAKFSYLDHDGEWHQQWPPRFGEPTHQLPAAVLLQAPDVIQGGAWLASIQAAKDPRIGLRLPPEFL